jgi:hypothetical protein
MENALFDDCDKRQCRADQEDTAQNADSPQTNTAVSMAGIPTVIRIPARQHVRDRDRPDSPAKEPSPKTAP